jgi:cell division protein ZapA (FtsZ GTPase activity inhibitor)
VTEPRRVELTVLGQALTLRSEAPPEYLRQLARYLEERVGTLKRAGVKDPTTALLLAALDIADELHRAREAPARTAGEVERRLDALVALLDEVTREASPGRSP